MSFTHSKGIILPEVTDDILNEMFNDDFFDNIMDKIFIEEDSETFRAPSLMNNKEKEFANIQYATTLNTSENIYSDISPIAA